jgi:hypothetical protein
MGGDTATSTKKKKGLFSRFKRTKKGKSAKDEKTLEVTPPPSPQAQDEKTARQSKETKKSVTKEGIPVVTGDNPDDFAPSDVRKTIPGQPAVSKSKAQKSRKARSPRPGSVVLDKPPTAREAAFSGPPRYDWIDVEVSLFVLRFILVLHDRHGGTLISFKVNTCIREYIHLQTQNLLKLNFGGHQHVHP